MPTASRKVRKIRRIKRERSLAYRLINVAIEQRDQARMIAGGLEAELKKYINEYGQLTPEEPKQPIAKYNTVADQLGGEADYDPTEAMIAFNEAKLEQGIINSN